MASAYPQSLLLSHFNNLVAPVDPDVDPSTYSGIDKHNLAKFENFWATGTGYFEIQSTKVCSLMLIKGLKVTLITFS